MSISLILFIVVHVIAFAYFLEVLRRVHYRSKEYPLEDTSETLPFGFIRLRHMVAFYVLVYIVWLFLSFLFYFVWIGHGLPMPKTNETILNL